MCRNLQACIRNLFDTKILEAAPDKIFGSYNSYYHRLLALQRRIFPRAFPIISKPLTTCSTAVHSRVVTMPTKGWLPPLKGYVRAGDLDYGPFTPKKDPNEEQDQCLIGFEAALDGPQGSLSMTGNPEAAEEGAESSSSFYRSTKASRRIPTGLR